VIVTCWPRTDALGAARDVVEGTEARRGKLTINSAATSANAEKTNDEREIVTVPSRRLAIFRPSI
jgi:hypothetical protein